MTNNSILLTCKLNAAPLTHHLTPVSRVPSVQRITVVRYEEGPSLPKIQYVCPPGWVSGSAVTATLTKTLLMLRAGLHRRPDLIYGIYLFPHGLVSYLVAKILHLPLVLSLIGSDVNRHLQSRFLGGVLRYIVRKADIVTVTGQKSRQELIDMGVDKKHIFVLPHGIDLDRFHPQSEQKVYDLVSVARLTPLKRIDRFLRVVAAVKEGYNQELRAVVLGDGPEREPLEQLAKDLVVADNVHFAGHVSNVDEYLAQSRVFVLLSESEGLPFAAIEAMACGLPCIVSNVNDVSDLVRDGETGYLIDNPDDLKGCSLKALDLLQEEVLYSKFSQSAASTVRDRYSVQAAVITWQGILERISHK